MAVQVVVLDTCGVSTALPVAAAVPASPVGFVATWLEQIGGQIHGQDMTKNC